MEDLKGVYTCACYLNYYISDNSTVSCQNQLRSYDREIKHETNKARTHPPTLNWPTHLCLHITANLRRHILTSKKKIVTLTLISNHTTLQATPTVYTISVMVSGAPLASPVSVPFSSYLVLTFRVF